MSSKGNYNVKPINRFKPLKVKEKIREVVENEYCNRSYIDNQAEEWSKVTIENIIKKLKEMELINYKFIVNVVLGEQRGAGIRVGSGCFWDSDADSMASFTFTSDELFCIVTVFAVYYY